MARAWLILVLTLVACTAPQAESPGVDHPASSTASAQPASAKDLPVVAVVRADWCPTCRRIEPTVMALQKEYAGRVSFVILDLTDDATTARSSAVAEQAGLGQFFRENKSTGIVAVFSRGLVQVAKLEGQEDINRYREPIANAMAAAP